MREFVRCTTKKYEKRCGLGFMVCKGLSAAIRKTCVAHMKVLSDLSILFPGASIDIQVLSDLAFILDILIQTLRRNSNTEEKVWKTFMSIECRRNTETAMKTPVTPVGAV